MASPNLASRAGALVDLARPGNLLMAAIGALVGALVAAGPGQWLAVGLAAGATALVTAGGNALNDVVDREIDRRAHPERPIPSGRLDPQAASWFGAVCFLAAIGLAWPVNVRLLALVLAAEGLLVGYELVWKARGLVGNLVVAALVGATFVAGALAVGDLTLPVGFLAGLAFLANVAREAWKDIEDADHDEPRATLAQRWGPKRTHRWAQVVTLGAVALSPLPYLVGFGGWPYLAVVGLADVAFLAAVFAGSPARSQRLSKAAMVTALAAFVLGGTL